MTFTQNTAEQPFDELFELTYHPSRALNSLRALLASRTTENQGHHNCSVLAKSHLGAKRDFEIWAFKGFLSLDTKNTP